MFVHEEPHRRRLRFNEKHRQNKENQQSKFLHRSLNGSDSTTEKNT